MRAEIYKNNEWATVLYNYLQTELMHYHVKRVPDSLKMLESFMYHHLHISLLPVKLIHSLH